MVADRKGRWGWMLYDWATQPYHTLLLTFIFGPYFTSQVVDDPARAVSLWAFTVGAAGLLVAVTAPILGALADASGPRKPFIAVFGLFYVAGASLLWFATPADANLPLVLGAFALGLIGVEFATVFNNAMMPGIAPPERIGRLSGSGWALGYVGGTVSLVIVLALLQGSPETGLTMLGLEPLFGLDPAQHEGARATGPLTALWFLVFIWPMFLFTPDARPVPGRRTALKAGLRQLGEAIRDLRRTPSLLWFLLSSMSYRDALNGFYTFGGAYAATVLGWSITQVGVFGVIAAVVGAAGAWIGGRIDSRFGPKPVVTICLFLLVLASVLGPSVSRETVFFVVPVAADSSAPDLIFYVVGGIIGAAGGAIQASSRSMLIPLADPARVASTFGLYAFAGKATAYVAPFAIGVVTAATGSLQVGFTPLMALFLLAFVLLLLVRMPTRPPAPAPIFA